MRALTLSLMLALSVPVIADDEWVSVGGHQAVAPAAATTDPVPSRFPQPAATPSQDSVATPPVATTNIVNPQAVIAASANAGPSSELLSELFVQMEQMQQEIATLRSLVESQAQQISQMEQAQQSRYLDLDRRVAGLFSAAKAPVVNPASALVTAPASTAASQTAETAAKPDPDSAYKQAMTLVREKQFEQAAQAFARFSQDYPQHSLVANSYYWAGEVYLVQGELEQAEQAFTQVVNQYGDHRKAADANYKLAVTWHKQGKTEQAKQQLQKVINDFSQRSPSTARLAKAYLEKIS